MDKSTLFFWLSVSVWMLIVSSDSPGTGVLIRQFSNSAECLSCECNHYSEYSVPLDLISSGVKVCLNNLAVLNQPAGKAKIDKFTYTAIHFKANEGLYEYEYFNGQNKCNSGLILRLTTSEQKPIQFNECVTLTLPQAPENGFPMMMVQY